ncbi:helix-turn-helix transcriptional regulator [Nocardioides coralli]|uniref:helix-turn-helix transcriptional regulator n=1 Tax=Nocardioides coralli TaxID=2872154 RepID=UPI001CA3D272|nr:helix-turn-helix transcriptional regulator [Nocardioides coralli]QZY30446.1 helix-turn-helix transcriptional regulator [Nocardioides coralli]
MTSLDWGVRPRGLAQVAHYPPGSSYGPRPLRDFELVWVLRGSARWTVTDSHGGARELDLRPGSLALARPGMVDVYRWDDLRPSAHAFVHFEVDHATAADPETWPLTRPFAGHAPLEALCRYLLDLASIGAAQRTRSDQIVELVLDLFVSGPLPRALSPVRVSPVVVPALRHVRSVWEAEGVRAVSVAELAHAASTSSGHFSRSFSQTFGCGPVSALELVRLGRAAMALQRSNLSIAEIARLHGFADPYHFSKRFASVYLSPPGRFRRREDGDDGTLAPLADRGLIGLWGMLVGDREP